MRICYNMILYPEVTITYENDRYELSGKSERLSRIYVIDEETDENKN